MTGPAVAVTVFFRTLAQVHRTRAFCIVMSGTGSDGAVGLARVKEEGGITFAQSEEDAEHGDMPRAAIATGMVDFVLPAAAMGPRLIELWTSAQQIQLAETSDCANGGRNRLGRRRLYARAATVGQNWPLATD